MHVPRLHDVPHLRSALFVPGHRERFLDKAAASGADAVILDLEDAVPAEQKPAARALVRSRVDAAAPGPRVTVRVNGLDTGVLDEDLDAAVGAGLLAVLVPKVEDPDDVARVSEALAYFEGRYGVPRGRTRIWPLIETARAVAAAGQIAAASPRVAYLGAGTSPDGDLTRALGYRWSPGGTETLYVRSKVLADARAAGVPHPVTGIVTDVADLEAVRSFAAQSRSLGYAGMMVIHPSHVPVVNEVFGVGADELAEARRLVEAVEAGQRAGLGAIVHDGRMVDEAMVRTARQLMQAAGEPVPDPG